MLGDFDRGGLRSRAPEAFGFANPLCLPARGCAATSIGHSKTTNRRFSPVTTMNQQPNIVQVRNGSPRSRSRSVSRSRSRSASPSAEREPRGNPYDLPTTSGEELAAKMAVRHLEKCGVAPTLREMTALPLGTVTGELLTKLVKQLEETRGDSVALDEPLAIDALAAEAGPATMPLPLLCNLMMEVLDGGSTLPDVRASTPGNKVMQKKLEKLSFKVTLGELSDAAEGDTHKMLMQLAEAVGNKYPELSLETPIDLNVLAAETGPEMPAIQLGCLILYVKGDRFP